MSYYICGVDEVGRGALAGPIIAVASLFRVPEKQADWSMGCPVQGVKDSKAFGNERKREEIYHSVLRCAELVDFGIGEVSVEEINKDGIDRANRTAFYMAVEDLKQKPNFILVDGNQPVPVWSYSSQVCKPKADALWWPVGAASILAKVIRDRYMSELHVDFPVYGWDENAGYGTAKHNKALKQHGPCPLHRKKFIEKIVGMT